MVGGLDDRSGQGLTVHLLVLVQRDAFDLHGGRRNHVRRFLLSDKCVQLLDVHLLIADDVGSDVLATVLILKGLHGCILDAWELANDGLDFLQLNAETANLHLSVLATRKLDVAVGQIADDVAGAVDAGKARIVAERIVDIDLGGLLGTVEVASRDMCAANPQFSQCALRQAIKLFINDIETRIVERFSYWNVLQFLVHLVLRDEDGAFGRAITIVQLEVLRRHQRSQFFSCRNQVQQRVVVHVGGKLVGHLRGHERVGDVVFIEVIVHRRQGQADVVADDIHARAASQRGIHVHHAAVEAVTGVTRHMMLGLQFKTALVPMAESGQVAMLQLATLGQTR